MRHRFAFAGCLALAAPALASAQTSDAPRVYVSINGGTQRSDNHVAQSFSVQKNFEDTPITLDVDEKRGVLFDGGFVVRLAGPIGMGFDVSLMTHDADADVTASAPHPFFFRQPRAISGTTNTTRRETAGHIRAVYLIPSRHVNAMIFGGSNELCAISIGTRDGTSAAENGKHAMPRWRPNLPRHGKIAELGTNRFAR